MKYLKFFFVAVVFCSCQENKPEVIDLNDIIAQSDNYNEDSIVQEIVEVIEFVPQLDTINLLESEIKLISPRQNDTLLFPDRYSPENKELFYYSIDSDSILFAEYNFKSSDYAVSVFQNWINCFGSKCITIPYGSEERIAKLPFLLMQIDQQIVYIYNCPKKEQEKWLNYYITEESNGKLIQQFTKYKSGWSLIEEGEIQPIENNENEVQ